VRLAQLTHRQSWQRQRAAQAKVQLDALSMLLLVLVLLLLLLRVIKGFRQGTSCSLVQLCAADLCTCMCGVYDVV
jgi:NADH:ubiquinone oxidoreductase subunit 4 (subunit M)